MTTNSKNSRMKYHGHNNNRLYQQDLSLKKERKEINRNTNKFLFGALKGLGVIFLCFFSAFRSKKNEEVELQMVEHKLAVAKDEQERRRKARERQAKKEAKENELFNQYFKHCTKLINGKYISVSLEEYRKMTDKERKEWNSR